MDHQEKKEKENGVEEVATGGQGPACLIAEPVGALEANTKLAKEQFSPNHLPGPVGTAPLTAESDT